MILFTRLKPLLSITVNHGIQSTRSKHSYVIRRLPIASLTTCGILSSIIGYDGIVNDFTICGATLRFLRSVKTATLICIDYTLLHLHESDEDYDLQRCFVHQRSANRLLETCLGNGGLYIKIGQGIAAINHILPKEYTETLAQLQDKCLPTSRKDVQQLFLKDFGQLPEHIFEEFDYKPVAAASLAQVFKAKLKSGHNVAVKVQYSDLQNRFTSDVGTIIFLHDIVELFFKNYNFGWILHDLKQNLLNEMDFINEAKNSERCATNLKELRFVHIPKVYWDYTKLRVLTMEWIDGFKVDDMEEIRRNKLNVRDIDVKLFKLFSEQIFCNGFVHADPHPGNIFVRKNEKTCDTELVLLDHGLYEEIPDQVRLPLCEFWEATVLRDEHKMEAAARKIHVRDFIKFAEVLFQQPMSINGCQMKTRLTESDMRYMQDMAKKNFDQIMNTLKEMPRNMLFVVRNLNTIRSISLNHGDVVDRPRIMARYAQHGIYNSHKTFVGKIHWLYRRTLFEYHLWCNALKTSSLNLYFNVLYWLGRAPESAKTILKDIHKMDYS